MGFLHGNFQADAHDDWNEIKLPIVIQFEATFVLNPFWVDKALVQMEDGRIHGDLSSKGKWMHIGIFHLKFEARDHEKPSKPEFGVSDGGWIKIMNIPFQEFENLQSNWSVFWGFD